MTKAADKVRATEEKDTFVSATFDLQSVLQMPSSDVSLLYYSRKLCVYNLRFDSSAPPNEAHCYCWSEVEGGRGSNEIGTCLFQWLSQLPPSVKEVSFYSDTCGGQNRNQNVAALLMYAVQNLKLRQSRTTSLRADIRTWNATACIQLSSAIKSMSMSTP